MPAPLSNVVARTAAMIPCRFDIAFDAESRIYKLRLSPITSAHAQHRENLLPAGQSIRCDATAKPMN